MRAFVILWQVVWTGLTVGLRRLFSGPKHPRWSFGFEVATEVSRKEFGRLHQTAGAPATGDTGSPDPLRRLASPIPPGVARLCRLKTTTLAGLATDVHEPRAESSPQRTLLYFHGGGYITCSPRSHRALLARLAVAARARVVAIDYRKAPEHPFPAAIDDCVAAYRALLETDLDPQHLAVGGDSAGGGLALALLQRIREAGLPQPACALLLSPWVDLESKGASIQRNEDYDYLSPSSLAGAVNLYLGRADPRNPLASAIHADFTDLPPLRVLTGDSELFYSENVQLVAQARAAGIAVDHEIGEGMIHVYPLFADLSPFAKEAIERAGSFIQEHCADTPLPSKASHPESVRSAVQP